MAQSFYAQISDGKEAIGLEPLRFPLDERLLGLLNCEMVRIANRLQSFNECQIFAVHDRTVLNRLEYQTRPD